MLTFKIHNSSDRWLLAWMQKIFSGSRNSSYETTAYH